MLSLIDDILYEYITSYIAVFPVGEFSVTYVLKLISLWGLIYFISNKRHKMQRETSLFTYSLIESTVIHVQLQIILKF